MTPPYPLSDLSLSVLVMAYNEVATLESVVQELAGEARTTCGRFEILIVDDGSTDGTGPLADRLAGAMPEVRVVHLPRNSGIGEVLRTGYREARNDLVAVFPADGQCPAASLKPFVALMASHDLVLAYIPKRKNPPLATLLSKAERLLMHFLFGPMPRFQGTYMFRRAVLDRFRLTSQGRGWLIQMELILRAQRAGCRIVSVPTEVRSRVSGSSKATSLRSVVANLKQVLPLFWNLQKDKFRTHRREAPP